MKVYTYVTPSHRQFLEEFFLPTAKEFDPVISEGPQMGSPTYGTPGFDLSMTEKAKVMFKASREPLGSIVLWSDVDVQFLAPCRERLVECLGSSEMAFQPASPTRVCAGFFVFRVTEKVRLMLGSVLADMLSGSYKNDEPAMNEYVRQVNYRMLPCGEFWTCGFSGILWDGTQGQLSRVRVPDEILVHHGNCCIGVTRKLELMRHVRSVVTSRA